MKILYLTLLIALIISGCTTRFNDQSDTPEAWGNVKKNETYVLQKSGFLQDQNELLFRSFMEKKQWGVAIYSERGSYNPEEHTHIVKLHKGTTVEFSKIGNVLGGMASVVLGKITSGPYSGRSIWSADCFDAGESTTLTIAEQFLKLEMSNKEGDQGSP